MKRDWAEKSVNFQTGCEYDCVYCYAKGNAYRYNQVEPGEWNKPQIRPKAVKKKYKNYGEVVMFPSSHDITWNNRREAFQVLSSLLSAGNQVTIVTKPNFKVTKQIVDTIGHYKDQILYMFTITSLYNSDFERWEPNAPRFQERFDSLKYAYDNNFRTSVSIEPMINGDCVVDLFYTLEPYVTDKIWIGKMNYRPGPVGYTQIKKIQHRLRNEKKVRYKTGTL